LSKNALDTLKVRQKQLKQEAKKVQAELRVKRKQKARILKKVAKLSTEDLVQALLDRRREPETASSGSGGSAAGSAAAHGEDDREAGGDRAGEGADDVQGPEQHGHA
jgi:hypothetical protein